MRKIIILFVSLLILVDVYLLVGNMIVMFNADNTSALFAVKTDNNDYSNKPIGIDAKTILYNGYIIEREKNTTLLIGVWVQDGYSFKKIDDYITIDNPAIYNFINKSRYYINNPGYYEKVMCWP